MESVKEFSSLLLSWFDTHGRKNLPWQQPRTAYRVWLSEIMLQQTQVQTVIPYFEKFVLTFPDIFQLAAAMEDEVLALWSGLGYYSRARNLHKAAQLIVDKYAGNFPRCPRLLQELPGIGPSTAAAILSQAFNEPHAILDGNVKRVLARYFLLGGDPNHNQVSQIFWQYARECMPEKRCADYTQAIMDLGALCCTHKNPQCSICPLAHHCQARQKDSILLYPQKKIKKLLPIKQERFLLIYDQHQRIYLEKRPPVGIWGGLWCLPVLAENTDNGLIHFCSLKHRFTHFLLNMDILIKKTATLAPSSHIAENNKRWIKFEEMSQFGLATPIKKILIQFYQLGFERLR